MMKADTLIALIKNDGKGFPFLANLILALFRYVEFAKGEYLPRKADPKAVKGGAIRMASQAFTDGDFLALAFALWVLSGNGAKTALDYYRLHLGGAAMDIEKNGHEGEIVLALRQGKADGWPVFSAQDAEAVKGEMAEFSLVALVAAFEKAEAKKAKAAADAAKKAKKAA